MIVFHDFESFIHLGGYSRYVWPAFLIGFVLLLSHYLFVRFQFHHSKKALKASEKRMRDDTTT